MKWNKYSLPYILHDRYKKNTDKNHSRFGGNSFFLAHVTDEPHLCEATAILSWVLGLPFMLINPFLILFTPILFYMFIAVIISVMDTYSSRKFRVKCNFEKSVDWILNKDPNKRRAWWQ